MRKSSEVDQENYYKEAFRVFFKDDTGCIPADELKFILRSLNVSQYTVHVRHSPYHPCIADKTSGDREDDQNCGQERRREDQLQRVPSDARGGATGAGLTRPHQSRSSCF